MTDLRYLYKSSGSSRMAIWKRNSRGYLFGVDVRKIAGVALVIVLLTWCLLLLPAAIDQSMGVVAPKISSLAAK